MIDRWKHFSISVWLGGGAWVPACKFWQIHRIWQILPNLCGLVQFYANLAFGKNLDSASSSSHCDCWLRRRGRLMQMYANLHQGCPIHKTFRVNIIGQIYVNLCKWLQMISSDWTTWDTGSLMLGRQSLAACKSKPTMRALWKFMQISTNLRQIFRRLYENMLYDVSPTANTCKFSPTLWKCMQIRENLPNLCLSCKSIQMRTHSTVEIDNSTYCPTWNSINPH